MKPLPAVLLLLTSALITQADNVSTVREEHASTINELNLQRKSTEEAITLLLGELPTTSENPDTAMPEREGAETVAVADGGMYFDASQSLVAYLGNVRVADSRLQLHCTDYLYIYFPKTEENKKADSSDSKKPKSNGDSLSAAAAIPHSTAENTASAAKEQQFPLDIKATIAVVDTNRNSIYLEAKGEQCPELRLSQAQNKLTLATAQAAPASILAATNGDVLIEGSRLDIRWTDKNGAPCSLINENGTACYRAADHSLYLEGPTTISTAEGTISGSQSMTLTLAVQKPEQEKSGFMRQFTDVKVTGIAGATASGDVRVTRPATQDRPAAEIKGEQLIYDGKTGETTISGKTTTLVYGEQQLHTDELLHMSQNGDITLKGAHITGNYSRQTSSRSGENINGTFSTSGTITFTAATHTITFPNGLSASDALSSIQAGGKVDIILQPDSAEGIPNREKTGMVNLAIAAHKDVAEIRATGGIELHYSAKAQESGLTLAADDAHLNFLTAEATMTSSAGHTTRLEHNTYKMAASAGEGTSTLYLAPNGDLTLRGDRVNATLPGKKTETTVACSDYMTLTRETGKLELGPGSRMQSESGILSSNGKLHITLTPGPAEKNRPLISRYPHLVFNYAGLQQADTDAGGTIQTAQASMQCTGPIHVEMMPESDSTDAVAGIRIATAAGNVAIAGKDSSGRIMRATGDLLTIDGLTGDKKLTGKRVTLQDARNTHIASGAGAQVAVDKNNNARISGAHHSTAATKIHEQIEKNKSSNKKK